MSLIIPVIMAGGVGSRLWPLSRTHYPKQFLPLASNMTMLQETILRLSNIEHLPPSIICNEEHRFLVAEQVRNIHIEHSGIILEPFGKNTAPAIALSALKALEDDQDPLLLVLPADHLIKNKEMFTLSINKAKLLALEGKLVTFGIIPSVPETGYGYIRHGDAIGKPYNIEAYKVDAFVEKPNYETAKDYISTGNYYWNSGIFLFKASRYIEELNKFRPDILEVVNRAYSSRSIDLDFIRINKEIFSHCPDESIDYAVMEHTEDAAVVPLDAGWNDIGSWSALWDIEEKDSNGNAIRGDVFLDSTSNSYIYAHNKLVATVGIDNLIIVETKDAILVANKNNVQNVKNIVSQLKKEKRLEYLQHKEVFRPWGKHELISNGERYHVKKVIVRPGEKTATQIHYHRAEHWIVVSGTAKVINGDNTYIITENQSTYIPVGSSHSFENPGKIDLEIIEVRTGSYLADDDIERTNIDSKIDGENY